MSTMTHKEELPHGLPFLGNSMLFIGLGILALSLTGTEWLPFQHASILVSEPFDLETTGPLYDRGRNCHSETGFRTEMRDSERKRNCLKKRDWMPEEPGQRFETLTVYTKENCPLCEEAVEILEDYAAYLPASNWWISTVIPGWLKGSEPVSPLWQSMAKSASGAALTKFCCDV